MRASADVDENYYPVGYLRAFGGADVQPMARVTDMRDLAPMHNTPVTVEQAQQICRQGNRWLRNGDEFSDVQARIVRLVLGDTVHAG